MAIATTRSDGMTELEKIAYAKTFIDKLANGINPIDGSAIPDGDVANNVRLSRCFFYVSDILRQVIDNGGINPAPTVKEKKPKKQAYFLLPEQAERFEYSDTPITATEISNRIIAVGPKDGVRAFPRKKLSKWLVCLGLIEEVEIGGEWVKRPTESGSELGILFEERSGQHGSYSVVLYNRSAQEFIVDNIDSMLAFDNESYRAKMNLDNQGKPWNDEQDALLIDMYKSGHSIGKIAAELKRGQKAIVIRLMHRGLYP